MKPRAIAPIVLLLILLAGVSNLFGSGNEVPNTVFIILMENKNWSQILGSANAPYINNTLLPMASYTEQYYNPPGVHPSEPNYLWLEAGTGFGIFNDQPPSVNHQSTTNHFVTQLTAAGISWKTYLENIPGNTCPTTDSYPYAARHNPFAFFDDVVNGQCISVMRPFSELATDLTNQTVARYNFITPNLINDMHDSGPPLNNPVLQGDTWLSQNVPTILNSPAYQNNGVLIVTWDEGAGSDGPIGFIVLSPVGKAGGYHNGSHYTHSSTLRTFQKIFGVGPLLGDAATALDLSDLFVPGAIPNPDPQIVRSDFNRDGETDYLLFNPSSRKSAIWNLHANTLLNSVYGPTLPANWVIGAVADVNGDLKKDFLLYNTSTRQTAIWYLNYNLFVSSAVAPTLPAGWSLIAAADFNTDSHPDYLLFNPGTRQTAIWYLNGGAFVSAAYGPTLPAGWTLRDAADFDGDNDPDLLLVNGTTRQTAIWYLTGLTRTGSAYGPTLPSGWTLQGTGDFNRDGHPDYVLEETSTRKTGLWYLNGAVRTGSAYGPAVASGYVLSSP